MSQRRGLRVVVDGDLPKEVLERISVAVQQAVRHEVANIDLLREYTECAPKGAEPDGTSPPDEPPVMGIVLAEPT
ncbi:hypothetical protein [Mycobacterium sp. 050134]|uniref:hypothetical protein n=1 Tax=Mycobacterium sp. 050134 TaxID=3096111 RepID=UPI002EDAB7BB